MNNLLKDKNAILPMLGSFWVRNMSRTDPYGLPLVKTLVRLSDDDGARGRFDEMTGFLTADNKAYRYNFDINIHGFDMTPVNSTTGEVTRDRNKFYLRSTGDPLPKFKWEGSATAHFLVPIDTGITPIVINTLDKCLVNGISFTSGDGWIRFFDSPIELFPNQVIHVAAAELTSCSLYDFTLSVDTENSDLNHLISFYRAKQTPYVLEVALNALAGRVVIKDDCIVRSVSHVEGSGTYTYITDDENVYTVNYPHTPLQVLEQLYRDQIIGRAIDVHAKAAEGDTNWWRSYFSGESRGNTLKLQDLHPALPDVQIPNYDVTLSIHSAGTGDSHLSTSELIGNAGDIEKYFSIVHNAEERTGVYWNAVFGLAGVDTVDTNLIDFMFEQVYDDRALIIDIDVSQIGQKMADRVAYVARRELPLGCVPFIRQWYSS